MCHSNFPPGTFGGVIVDPPWTFTTRSKKGITPKGAGGQYSTMTLDDIFALPVRDLMADNSIAIVWATFPMLGEALDAIDAWGLDYVSGGAWAKQSKTGAKWGFGTGYVLRSASEPFLVARKGRPKIKSRSARNLIVAPVREHSRKPEAQLDLLEAIAEPRYLELFSRQESGRENWVHWGDQLNKFPGHC